MKEHSFLKQCFAGSSLDTIWGYFQQVSAENQQKVPPKLCQVKIVQKTVLKMNGLQQKTYLNFTFLF